MHEVPPRHRTGPGRHPFQSCQPGPFPCRGIGADPLNHPLWGTYSVSGVPIVPPFLHGPHGNLRPIRLGLPRSLIITLSLYAP